MIVNPISSCTFCQNYLIVVINKLSLPEAVSKGADIMLLNYAGTEIFINPYVIMIIGFSVGLLGAFFGFKAMFFTVPAMNIFGIPMVFAVGSDLAHACGKSLFDNLYYNFFKHIQWRLALILAGTGVMGLWASSFLIAFMEHYQVTDIIIKCLYIVLLSICGLVLLKRNNLLNCGLSLLPKFSRIKIPPKFHLNPVVRVSFWIPVLIGLAGGLLTGLLGGGAFLARIPLLMYFLAVPLPIAVATDFIALLITAVFGVVLWSQAGYLAVLTTTFLFVGVIIGSQFGYAAAKAIPEEKVSAKTKETLLIMAGIKTVGALILMIFGFVKFAKLLIIAAVFSPSVIIIIYLMMEKIIAGISDEEQYVPYNDEDYYPVKNIYKE